jgi:N-methylhydantoinase B
MDDKARNTEIYKAGRGAHSGIKDNDPITTEIVRNALNSAANQMKRTLVRASFSPVVYEVLDFAVALYDKEVRLLSQAPSLPIFMATMSFCIEAAVEGVGGEEELYPGDVILYNLPYGTGSHAQDAAIVMPVFLDDGKTLIGYATNKAHWMDIAAKEPYCTDTTDIFQEGVIFPGVKLYSKGEKVRDIFKMVEANSRMPVGVLGDINAQIASVRVGAKELLRVVNRFGKEIFEYSVERMFDAGELVIRKYFENIDDGRYVGHGVMDDNGVDTDLIEFDVIVEVDGSTVRMDYSNAPDVQRGPINCPLPSTVSASRVAITMLAGAGEPPNEGHLRPVEVITRPGSMFHPLPPAPCYLYGWSAISAMEGIYEALAKAVPTDVPAGSAADICAVLVWGQKDKKYGEPWFGGSPFPMGQGGFAKGDGDTMIHVAEAAARFPPVEVWEALYPWIFEKFELRQDSAGAGEHRGGLGIDIVYEVLEDFSLISTVERTKVPGWAAQGGKQGKPNGVTITYPDGKQKKIGKITGLQLPKGSKIAIHCGGGGGYGDPKKRSPELVERDLREGYISQEFAELNYN